MCGLPIYAVCATIEADCPIFRLASCLNRGRCQEPQISSFSVVEQPPPGQLALVLDYASKSSSASVVYKIIYTHRYIDYLNIIYIYTEYIYIYILNIYIYISIQYPLVFPWIALVSFVNSLYRFLLSCCREVTAWNRSRQCYHIMMWFLCDFVRSNLLLLLLLSSCIHFWSLSNPTQVFATAPAECVAGSLFMIHDDFVGEAACCSWLWIVVISAGLSNAFGNRCLPLFLFQVSCFCSCLRFKLIWM